MCGGTCCGTRGTIHCNVSDSSRSTTRQRRVLVLASLLLALTAPGQTIGISPFIPLLVDDLGLSRTSVSTGFLLGTLTAAAGMGPIGRLIDRHGSVVVAQGVGVGLGVVLVLASRVTGIVSLTFAFVGLRLLGQGALQVAATTSVMPSFPRRRGQALGVVSAAGEAAMALSPVAFTAAVMAWGWRGSWSLIGLSVAAAVVLLTAVFPADRPVLHGPRSRALTATGNRARSAALRSATYRAVVVPVVVNGAIVTGLFFHQFSLLAEAGIQVVGTALLFLPQVAATIVGSLIMGRAADRVSPLRLLGLAMLLLTAALLLAARTSSVAMAIAYVVMLGGALGAVRAVEAAAIPRYFGLDHVGALRGRLFALAMVSTAVGPLAIGFGADALGSFRPVLSVILPIPLACAGWLLLRREAPARSLPPNL